MPAAASHAAPLRRRITLDVFVLVCCIVAAGAYSLYRGQDADWDLKNYHFYNAFAFVHHRLHYDVAPAQLQSYNNPLIELPFYFLVTALNDHPKVVSFTMGLPAAIAIYFLLKTLLVGIAASTRERGTLIVFSLLFGIAGAAGIAQWGTAMNEWQVATLDAVAVFILVRGLASGTPGPWVLVSAGALCGIAAGLKLTAASSCVAVFVALLCIDRGLAKNVRAAAIFATAVTIGLLVAAGPWMLAMYKSFHNPLFPYFNEVFRSPWWAPRRIVPVRFGPKSLLDAAVFPLQMLHKNSLASEPYLRDWHLPLLYLAGLAAVVMTPIRRIAVPRNHTPLPLDRAERFVVVFVVVYYAVWLGMFAIYRYLIQLELLSGWVFAICLRRLLPRASLRPWLILVLLALWATKINPSWGRVPFGERFFDVSVPELPRRPLVLLTSGQPLAYVIPFFSAGARFVGLSNNLVQPGMKTLLSAKITELIAKTNRPLFAMDLAGRDRFGVLRSYGLAVERNACMTIHTNLDRGGIALCKVKRLSAPR